MGNTIIEILASINHMSVKSENPKFYCSWVIKDANYDSEQRKQGH